MTRQTQQRLDQPPKSAEYSFTIRPDSSVPDNLTQESFVDYDAQAVLAEFKRQLDSEPSSSAQVSSLLNSVRSKDIREYLLDALLTSEPQIFANPEVRAECFEALLAYATDPNVMLIAAQEFACHPTDRQSCQAAFELISAGDLTNSAKAHRNVKQVTDAIPDDTIEFSPGQEYALKALGNFPEQKVSEYEILVKKVKEDYQISAWSKSLDKLLETGDPRVIRLLCDIAEGKFPFYRSFTNPEGSMARFRQNAVSHLIDLMSDERSEKIVFRAIQECILELDSDSTYSRAAHLLGITRPKVPIPILESLSESKNPLVDQVLIRLIGSRDETVKALALAVAMRRNGPDAGLRQVIDCETQKIVSRICDIADGRARPDFWTRVGDTWESLKGYQEVFAPTLVGGAFFGLLGALFYGVTTNASSGLPALYIFATSAVGVTLAPVLYSLSHLLPLRRSQELRELQTPALNYLIEHFPNDRAKQIVKDHLEDQGILAALAHSGKPEANQILASAINHGDETWRCQVLDAILQMKNPSEQLLLAVQECKRDVSAEVSGKAIKIMRKFREISTS